MSNYPHLPSFTSEKPCPRCKELLHWDESASKVHFDTRTGFVSYVDLLRYCIGCGYREVGFVNIDQQPVRTEIRE